ncbi:MAG: hypothetical protein H0T46_26575 [Deltaproteobacteria bacterium]|nr:hypothetical protein [Deltaproteobacteria bacterium]
MGPDEAAARQVLLDMMDLLSRDPYEALGLIPSATAADIRHAFLTKTKQFHPARFGRMAIDIQKLANEVFLSLRAAHDTIARPSTVPKPAALRPLGPTLLKPSGSGPTPVHRQSGAMPVGPAVARTSTPTRPGPMPGSTQPIRPVTASNPVLNNRPTGATASAQPAPIPSQGTQPIRTDPRVPTLPTRPGSVPGRPATGQTPILPRPAAAPAPGARLGGPPVERELAPILDLIAQQQLAAAKVALETLVARTPQSTKYRALLAYAKGREAQLEKRVDEARVELQDALQLDPDLQLAKTALAELFSRRR